MYGHDHTERCDWGISVHDHSDCGLGLNLYFLSKSLNKNALSLNERNLIICCLTKQFIVYPAQLSLSAKVGRSLKIVEGTSGIQKIHVQSLKMDTVFLYFVVDITLLY